MLIDRAFMQRALELARRGAGLVSPNPMVGAVLVRDGRIVGEGFHRYDLLKHAESYAIEMAGPLAMGATLYCSLEPCCHHGRTPPCTDALIRAGIKRAVVAMADPNPRVSGRGVDQLRAAGVDVDLGLLEGEARRLNESYLKYIRQGIPFVHGVIVDGADRIDSQSPEAVERRVNSEQAVKWQPSARFCEMASEYDAVVLGSFQKANRSIVGSCLSRNRHRPLVIAARREYICEFNRDTSLDGASVNDVHERAEGLIAADRPVASSDAVFVELDLQGADPGGTASAAVGGGISADSRSSATKSGSELDLLLERLAEMRATSVLLLPCCIGPLASSDDARIDRLTIVRGQNSSDGAGRDPLSGLDSFVDYSLIHETSDFVEITGRLRGPVSGYGAGPGRPS